MSGSQVLEPVPELPRTDEHRNVENGASLAPERVEFVEHASCSPWRVWGTRSGFLLLMVGVVFGVVTGMRNPETEVTYANVATETVSRGPFQVFITERGMVDSAQNVTLSSKVYWTTTIVKLIPEGTRVKEGELLCELDSTELREKAKPSRPDSSGSCREAGAREPADSGVDQRNSHRRSEVAG